MRKKVVLALIILILGININYAQNGITPIPKMVSVQGGSFKMGFIKLYESHEPSLYADNLPIHTVTLDNFEISMYPITVFQYKLFCEETDSLMPEAPLWGWHDDYPIVNITWLEAEAYTKWLSEKTGEKYRLPTEAQWEYAARGGQKSKGYGFSGADILNVEKVAWIVQDSKYEKFRTNPVGKLQPNELGIYDMTGNIDEWCRDWYSKDYYSQKNNQDNPTGPNIVYGSKVTRGGGWKGKRLTAFTVAVRDSKMPDKTNTSTGFRIVKEH